MSSRLLNKAQLRDRFGVSDPTLHRWLKVGLLPKPVYVGARSPRWPEDEIDALIAGRIERRADGAAAAAELTQAATKARRGADCAQPEAA